MSGASMTVERKAHGRAGYQMGQKMRTLLGDIATWAVLLLGSVIMILPFLWMLSGSVKSLAEIYAYPPTIIPKVVQFENYIEVWRRLPFHLFFMNSFLVSTSVTLGVLFTSSLAGYSFSRLHYPGRDAIFLFYLATMMIPFAVTLIPMYALMSTLHWVDTLTALIVPSLFSAWGTFLNRSFMMTIPRELEDAALIDGCSYFRIYLSVILPLSKPVVATLAIFEFMGVWNDFLWPLIMISSMKNKTLPLGLAAFQAMASVKTPWHLIMTASVMSVIPILVLFVVGQKYYVQGIVTTGLKGAA